MKRSILAALAAIALYNLLQYLGHSVWMFQDYHETAGIWRLPEQVPVQLLVLASSIYAALFARFYEKFHEHRGVIDGARFGTYATWLVSLPFVLTQYALLPIPPLMAAKWLGLAFVENMALGALLGAIYGSEARRAAPNAAGAAQ